MRMLKASIVILTVFLLGIFSTGSAHATSKEWNVFRPCGGSFYEPVGYQHLVICHTPSFDSGHKNGVGIGNLYAGYFFLTPHENTHVLIEGYCPHTLGRGYFEIDIYAYRGTLPGKFLQRRNNLKNGPNDPGPGNRWWHTTTRLRNARRLIDLDMIAANKLCLGGPHMFLIAILFDQSAWNNPNNPYRESSNGSTTLRSLHQLGSA